jgi:hypothetical protein
MSNTRRTEPIITPKELRRRFLFGVDHFTDVNGETISDETLKDYISIATDMLEKDLDIKITPHTIEEEKDYFKNDYDDWGYLLLNEVPVRKITSLVAKYPDNAILDYPEQWFKLRKEDGILRLLPGIGSYNSFMVTGGGQLLPEIFKYRSTVPQLFVVTYEAGFEDGKIPMAVNAAIGLLAAIFALNILGDIVLGAGIAASSLSLDSLSQSINTTSSAENHALSSKLKEYQKQLFGESINSPNRGLIRSLRDYYSGQRMNII